MAPVKTLLSLFALLSALPVPTLGVDLRQYVTSTSCNSGSYWECRDMTSGSCCGPFRLQIYFRGFSCAGCSGSDTHALFHGTLSNVCQTLYRAETGGPGNCMATDPEEGRGIWAQRWCRNCAARNARLEVAGTGEEVECERTVEPDVLVFENRPYNLTAMSEDEKTELARFVVEGGKEMPQVFRRYTMEE